MDVDAGAVHYGSQEFLTAHDKGPLHLAIVATLASSALSSYLLRVFIHGRPRRRYGITDRADNFFMLVAVLCTIGAFASYIGAIRLGLGKLHGAITSTKSVEMGMWTFAVRSCHIFGMGLVRMSVVAYLLIELDLDCLIVTGWMLAILLPFMVLLSVEWLIALNLQCWLFHPTYAYDPFYKAEGDCYSAHGTRSWAITNFTINITISVLMICSVLPLAASSSATLGRKVYNSIAVGFGFLACAAAILRLRMVITSWATIGYRNHYDLSFNTWAVVELSTWVLAANMPPLYAFFSSIIPPLRKPQPQISAPVANTFVHTAGSTYDAESCNSRNSSQTVIYRPNTAYFPSHSNSDSITRFHDDESNLTFDIKTPSTHSPAKSQKSGTLTETGDSRRVSDWSQFSGFTYYTNPSSDQDEDGEEKKEKGRARVSTLELEEITKSLGIERGNWGKEKEKDGEGVEAGGKEENEEETDESESSNGDSVSLQSEADSSEVTVQRVRARS